ncbi:GNAT family protein [Bacillus wiedmannii]|uniref:GNAT family N-acetyltransferase n=1 Tax=Bacillus wiedmannii TaxID=1890302 RepID=UPI0027309842|nr:GNAT family protein [Bacillus wiedmannii]MDP1459804.1 GNAT family protein [Bacillus wiedmannii]
MKKKRVVEGSICIREIEEEDIECLRNWRNQENIKKYFINQDDITVKQQEEWFQNYKQKQDDKMFVIEETTNGYTKIGAVALYHINFHTHTVEFGRLMIGNELFVGKGYGKQAANLVCKYAFEVLNMEKIYLRVLVYNIKAIQLYHDIGFVIEKRNANDFYMILKKERFLLML